MNAPPGAPLPATSAAPVHALTCPRCQAAAAPAPGVQACRACGGSFTLRAGACLDPSARPPQPDARSVGIRVKAGGLVLSQTALAGPWGVAAGVLDPVTGMIPLDEGGLGYGEIHTIAVWRKVAIGPIVAGTLLALPFAVLLTWTAIASAPVVLVLALPFWGLFAWALYRAIGVQAHMMRIVGVRRSMTVRFDSPMWRRRRFHDEVLRRAGIAASPIP